MPTLKSEDPELNTARLTYSYYWQQGIDSYGYWVITTVMSFIPSFVENVSAKWLFTRKYVHIYAQTNLYVLTEKESRLSI
jgi:hypothetical protein